MRVGVVNVRAVSVLERGCRDEGSDFLRFLQISNVTAVGVCIRHRLKYHE